MVPMWKFPKPRFRLGGVQYWADGINIDPPLNSSQMTFESANDSPVHVGGQSLSFSHCRWIFHLLNVCFPLLAANPCDLAPTRGRSTETVVISTRLTAWIIILTSYDTMEYINWNHGLWIYQYSVPSGHLIWQGNINNAKCIRDM